MCSNPAHKHFQFPQSERTNCNLSDTEKNWTLKNLSVSTIGTNELQLILPPAAVALTDAFSFHNRNERTATASNPRAVRPSKSLSVSTIGTNELQPALQKIRPSQSQSFSFHNRNERTATRNERPRARADDVLSVSTIGTNELQPAVQLIEPLYIRNFQFPQSERTNCNIVFVLAIIDIVVCFQFPQSERTNCNIPTTICTSAATVFQFPQSERTNCNQSEKT